MKPKNLLGFFLASATALAISPIASIAQAPVVQAGFSTHAGKEADLRKAALSTQEMQSLAAFTGWRPLAAESAAAATPSGDLPLFLQQTAGGQEPAAAPDSKGLSVPTEQGFAIFQQTCLMCHGTAAYPQAPSPATLRTYPPEKIYDALTTGAMKAVGDTLTDTQKRLVSQAVAGRLLGTSPQGDASKMPNQCPANARPLDPAASPQWNGWGNSVQNLRLQPAAAAGLSAQDVSHLKLKWAFGLPNSTSSYSQPTVVGGRVFIGTDTGYVYSVDAKTGCVYWSFLADAGVRNALSIEPIAVPPVAGASPGENQGKQRYAAYFGDLKANVYAVDAETGKLIWTTHVEDQYTTRVTAPPAYYQGTLFVPVSSWEEFSARSVVYPCCTSVGSVVALDAATGKRLWKTYVIPERPKPVGKNSKGVMQYAPAGGSVWNTPTVDAKLQAIYFGTGDATTFPAAETSDSVMALDIKTGRMLWTYQVQSKDSYLTGCRGETVTENCPKTEGPDWDIPCPPILANLSDGRRLILVGTKQGDILALDPDQAGKLVWRMNVTGALASNQPLPPGVRRPGVQWGGAVDGQNLYYGLTNGGGAVAIDLSTGKLVWTSHLASGTKEAAPNHGPPVSYASPATVIPGVVFVGGSDGNLAALSTSDGSPLWSFDTNRTFDTVNQVAAHGGSFGSQGATVAGGMLFAGSGYSVTSGQSGNVLLAFSTE